MALKITILSLFFLFLLNVDLWAQTEVNEDDTLQSVSVESARKKRDSVPPPPMQFEEVKARFEQLRYKKGDLEDLEEMQKRKNALDTLISNASWLVRWKSWSEKKEDGATQSEKLAFQIRQSSAVLKYDMTDQGEKIGIEAMDKFLKITVKDIFLDDGKKVNTELLDYFKKNLFYSRKPYNTNCERGIGRWLGDLRKDIDRRLNCRGYAQGLGDDFLLWILKTESTNQTVAVITDKNIDRKSYGVIIVW